MEAFFIYLLKSSAIILLFLVCYRLFLSRETFHVGNRCFLLTGLVAALVFPLVTYTETVWIDAPSVVNQIMISTGQAEVGEASKIDWALMLFLIYAVGVLLGIANLTMQFLSLRNVFRNSDTVQKGKVKLLEANKPVRPFSFFNYIILHPESHSKDDIKTILAHEEAHMRQYHSADILFVHFFTIFQWCNPFIYPYKFYVKENLEFVADAATLKAEIPKEKYQYLLLENNIDEKHFPFVNKIFNSSIKKRIVMLNKEKSKKRNLSKFGIIVPALIAFVLLFNVKTEAKIKDSAIGIDTAEFQGKHPKVYFINKNVTDEGLEQLAAINRKRGR